MYRRGCILKEVEAFLFVGSHFILTQSAKPVVTATHTYLHLRTPLPGTKSCLFLSPRRAWLETESEREAVHRVNQSVGSWKEQSQKSMKEKNRAETVRSRPFGFNTQLYRTNQGSLKTSYGWVETHVSVWLTYVGMIQHFHDPHLPEELRETKHTGLGQIHLQMLEKKKKRLKLAFRSGPLAGKPWALLSYFSINLFFCHSCWCDLWLTQKITYCKLMSVTLVENICLLNKKLCHQTYG